MLKILSVILVVVVYLRGESRAHEDPRHGESITLGVALLGMLHLF